MATLEEVLNKVTDLEKRVGELTAALGERCPTQIRRIAALETRFWALIAAVVIGIIGIGVKVFAGG
ncbi:MAG TPA: hypothetical protein VM537_24465 [Anaerolineae bacterium]|nr:hypothetical protein [Anaerolineae bacterium]